MNTSLLFYIRVYTHKVFIYIKYFLLTHDWLLIFWTVSFEKEFKIPMKSNSSCFSFYSCPFSVLRTICLLQGQRDIPLRWFSGLLCVLNIFVNLRFKCLPCFFLPPFPAYFCFKNLGISCYSTICWKPSSLKYVGNKWAMFYEYISVFLILFHGICPDTNATNSDYRIFIVNCEIKYSFLCFHDFLTILVLCSSLYAAGSACQFLPKKGSRYLTGIALNL